MSEWTQMEFFDGGLIPHPKDGEAVLPLPCELKISPEALAHYGLNLLTQLDAQGSKISLETIRVG